jgi:hypothetical protein
MSRLVASGSGGLIDRSQPLNPSASTASALKGFAGDTLASALLANDVKLVGRSFKYHRPRGILLGRAGRAQCAGELRDRRAAPSRTRKATVGRAVRRARGRAARTAGPRLAFDLRAVNSAVRRRCSSPASTTRPSCGRRAFWEKVYEPLIRRAAGLGRAQRPRRSRPLREGACLLRPAGDRRRPGRAWPRRWPRARRRARHLAARISCSAAACCPTPRRSPASRRPHGRRWPKPNGTLPNVRILKRTAVVRRL